MQDCMPKQRLLDCRWSALVPDCCEQYSVSSSGGHARRRTKKLTCLPVRCTATAGAAPRRKDDANGNV